MSFHVPRTFTEIDGKNYNLSFIILKTGPGRDWTHFFHRVNWEDDIRIPKSFYTLDLGDNGRHVFHPCAPFQLSRDECANWLKWDIVRPSNANGDEIKMLLITKEIQEIIDDENLPTSISQYIQFDAWTEQLNNNQAQPLGNLSRMEGVVRSTIINTLKQSSNNFFNKSRQDDSDRRNRRSRSPPQRGFQNIPTDPPQQPTHYGAASQSAPFFLPQMQYQQPMGQTIPMGQQMISQQQFLPQQQMIQPQQWNTVPQNLPTGGNR